MFVFLKNNRSDIADECEKRYIECSSESMLRLTKPYIEWLMKSVVDVANKDDFIG